MRTVVFSFILYFSEQWNQNAIFSEKVGSCFPPESPLDPQQEYAVPRYFVLGIAVTAIFLTTSVMSLLEPWYAFLLISY